MSKLFEKSWIPASARTSTTFNAPGSLSIPYGRYSAKITGRGSPGNAPNAATWNTNYNVAYPVGNQPVTGSNDFYQWFVTQLDRARCFGGWASAPLTIAPYAGIVNINTGYTEASINSNYCVPGFSPYGWGSSQYVSGANLTVGPAYNLKCQQVHGTNAIDAQNQRFCQRSYVPGNPNYTTNYNTVYPLGNRPVATYNVANAGTPANLLGVPFPGGSASAQIGVPNPAPLVSNTPFSYWELQDNRSAPVTVPSGGTVTITLE